MRAKLDFDLERTRECGLPDVLLSGIFRCPISHVDVFSIERWNGLRTIATSFTLDIEFKGHVYHRRVQLMHPFGIYPFPQYKVDAIKEREREAWKGFILSSGATTTEIELIADSFLEYPVQGTTSTIEFYRLLESLKVEMEEVKESFQCFVGRTCLIQVVDSGAKDHTGAKRNFALSQFLSDKAGNEVYKAYKENLSNDVELSSIGLGATKVGYGGGQ